MNNANLLQTQLFLDDRWVESSVFIERRWHQPKKWPDMVMGSDFAWERHAGFRVPCRRKSHGQSRCAE